jgi:hypothetical protein
MTLDVSNALPYGPLTLDEVFFEHDGPKLFSLRSRSLGVRILGICVDEDEEAETLTYLYLALGPERYLALRSGNIGLRFAIDQADQGCLWRAIEDYSGDAPTLEAEVVSVASLSEADLPSPEARLNLPTPTVALLDQSELEAFATQGLRTVAAIELEANSENATEFPLRALGAVGTALQESVDALAQEEAGKPTERGAIPPTVTEQVQMAVLGLRAASFALVIGTDKRGGMMDHAPFVEATLGRLSKLISDGGDASELTTSLRGYGPRARNKFAALLRAVTAVGSGIGVIAVPQSGQTVTAQMSSRDVVAALVAIDAVEPAVSTVEVRRGALIGLNTRRHTFELTDLATMERFAGKVASEAFGAVDGLNVGNSSFVAATLKVEIDFAVDDNDQEAGRRFTLVSIYALEE